MSDVHNGPADLFARIRAAEPREAAQAAFEAQARAVDAGTWPPNAGVSQAYIVARSEIDDRVSDSRAQRERQGSDGSFADSFLKGMLSGQAGMAARSKRLAEEREADDRGWEALDRAGSTGLGRLSIESHRARYQRRLAEASRPTSYR